MIRRETDCEQFEKSPIKYAWKGEETKNRDYKFIYFYTGRSIFNRSPPLLFLEALIGIIPINLHYGIIQIIMNDLNCENIIASLLTTVHSNVMTRKKMDVEIGEYMKKKKN